MKLVRVFFLIIFYFCLSSTLQPDKKTSWTPLFNGKDLSGWVEYGSEKWVVKNGEILGEALTKKYGYLGTKKTYRDFELKAKFKGEGTGNSGIFYHSSLEGINIKGVQVEVDPNPGKHTGGLYESGGRGWLVQPGKTGQDALKPGKWNEIRFSVKGNHVTTYLNGIQAIDFHDRTPKYFNGIIALQLHSGGKGKMRFKDLYIRKIQ